MVQVQDVEPEVWLSVFDEDPKVKLMRFNLRISHAHAPYSQV